METNEETVVVTECMNCGDEIEPIEFDGQGEIWCDKCIAKLEEEDFKG